MGTSLAAESLLSLAVTVTSEQCIDSVMRSIVQGLASQPGVALARIWQLPSADLPSYCCAVPNHPDDLCLVASAGTPINSPGEDWSFLRGHFAGVPFNVGKVGQVAASRHPILVEDVAAQNDWVVRPEWAKREEIRSFAGHPLIFRDKLLGVIGVFSRQPLGQQEFTWLGLFANQAAVAIANARAEEALRSSERNLATIINTIPTAAWTTRPDGYCDFLNQVWLDYAGMTAEQAQGWGWAEAIHPDDRKKLVEEWQSCLASGIPVDTEARIRRFDGSYRWFLIRANPLRDEAGNILKWNGTCIDIEDRKRGELDNMPGFVARLSPDGTIEMFSRSYLQYSGKTQEEINQWRTSDLVHPDDLAHTIEVFGNAISTGQPFELEHRIRRFDGVYRWFQARFAPVRDVEGRILHWDALDTDIDDRKKAEEALNKTRSEFAHVARITTLNALTASIAHEINQPLASLVTNASICLRRLNADPPNVDGARETVQRTIRDANRASDVITRLRALYTKKEFTFEPLDLNAAAQEVIALSLSDLQGNRVILKLELADGLPLVNGDRVQLQQVILNLVRNASDAMGSVDDRPRDLLIRTEREGADRVRFSVKDGGLGFTPEAADKLFQAFYTTKNDGMGIGLHVSRSIIEAHHGRLWATANDGPGATFSFAIPCRREGIAV